MRRRKIAGLGALAVVALIASAVAWSYYGGSGSGTATASAGHAPRTVTVTGSLDAGGGPLYPGSTGEVNISVALTGPGNARVGAVTLDTAQGDLGISGLPVGCLREWFDFTPPVAAQFPPGANVTAGTPLDVVGYLMFVESDTLQDACSDAALVLHLTASPN